MHGFHSDALILCDFSVSMRAMPIASLSAAFNGWMTAAAASGDDDDDGEAEAVVSTLLRKKSSRRSAGMRSTAPGLFWRASRAANHTLYGRYPIPGS